MGMKKTTSLKASFWKFLCMLLIGLIGAVVIPFSLILAGTSTGPVSYTHLDVYKRQVVTWAEVQYDELPEAVQAVYSK